MPDTPAGTDVAATGASVEADYNAASPVALATASTDAGADADARHIAAAAAAAIHRTSHSRPVAPSLKNLTSHDLY